MLASLLVTIGLWQYDLGAALIFSGLAVGAASVVGSRAKAGEKPPEQES